MTLTRLRGRSHFGAAKARPRQGGATLSHPMGEGLGVRAQFRFGWYFQVAPALGGDTVPGLAKSTPSWFNPSVMNRALLTRFAWISIAAAIFTIALKTAAYFITDSVGLLSDAIESVVNLAGGIMALAMLTVAARPADEDHAYGHSKAEYFSSGVEGGLILVAALSIAVTAVARLIAPKPLAELGLGLVVSLAASLINLAVALVLLRAGHKYNSITLEADAHHLLTDVWTSVGVLAGVGLVALTGWNALDAVVALLVTTNIIWTGVGIVRRSISGLMDTMLSAEDLAVVRKVLDRHAAEQVQFHALRTRQAGARKFVSVHVLVPGEWTVQRGHELLERIEGDIRQALPDTTVFTHLESLDDPASWDDQTLERGMTRERPREQT
jgi:cation diffusion facilitator family transporter